jgi:twitching motility protein PilI
MDESSALRGLRDRPFELLAALERRGRGAVDAAGEEAAREWVGIALRLAGELCLIARDEAREVLAVPPQLTRIPGAKAWVKGLANVHGGLLPVIDLRQYLGGGVTLQTRQTRILVANHREVPAGFLVDEVLGFRRFAATEFSGTAPAMSVASDQYLAGAFRRGAEQWPVLSLRLLVENPGFLDAAA